MAAGDFDTRIEIKGNLPSEDDFGQLVAAWSTIAEVWAKIEYGSGSERRVGVAREQASIPATIEVRKSPLTSALKAQEHRLEFDGEIWDIESVSPGTGKMRGKSIFITAKASK